MATPPQLTPEQRQAFADALYAGRKIEAIKQLRELSGLGLKESKALIDKLEAELRTVHPERFTAKSSKGSCAVALLIIIVMTGVVIYALWR
jgi:ribosomal protein L7/L12